MKTVGAENGVITASPPALEAKCAASLQAEITRYGSLEAAIASLWNDDCPELLNAALRYRRESTETLDQRAFRLGVMAADKDAEAERHMAAEADAAGRAAGRRLRGNDDALAASFDREAAACLACAQDAMAEAERLRSQANSIQRSVRRGDVGRAA